MLLKRVSGVLGHIKIASNKPQTSANPDLCIGSQRSSETDVCKDSNFKVSCKNFKTP